MSYVSQTPNLGLPQWILSEPPQMSDFNGAFSSIDQFAGEKGQPNGLATLDAEGNLVQSHAAGYKLSVAQGGTGASDPVNARSNLGLMKKLWSGNWTSGNITAEGFQDYTLFFLHPYGGAHSIIAMKVGNTLRGIGGQAGDGNQTILTLQATCNGNTLSGLKCFWMNHAVSGDHGAKTDVGIADIYGVC